MSFWMRTAEFDSRWRVWATTTLFGLALAAVAVRPAAGDGETPLKYPAARKAEVTDTFHGTSVPDPYRWLEATPEDGPEVRTWIEAQNKLTGNYLAQIQDRGKIFVRLSKLWDYERYNPPIKRGGRYFFTKNDGLQNQDVLHWAETISGPSKVLLDPNPLSEEGVVSLRGWAPSEDGKLLAYGLQAKGSDWMEWRVREVDTGKDRADLLKWVKFSGASWTKDGEGFFYSRYDEPKGEDQLQALNYFQKLYYHKLGTPQSEDRLIYERKDHKDWNFSGSVTDDGRYLIISVGKGTERKNLVFYKDLEQEDSPIVELIPIFDAVYDFIDNDGKKFYFRTDFQCPRGRVVAVDIERPDRDHWSEVVPQVTATLNAVSSVGGKMIARYLNDAHSKVAVFSFQGQLESMIELPEMGTAGGFFGQKDDPETFYSFESFTTPKTIYRYDASSGQTVVFRRPMMSIDSAIFETKQVFYKSKDGTQVPMFLTYKKGLATNGQNPTLLYGYGGFDIPITPFFSVSSVVWLEMGGMLAVANIRGGGEYGSDWHEAGMKLKKQNCFDDFIAAAEWLIANKYTSAPKLAITGGSNGGLLVGASMTQRPDLFGAALPSVGVLDMLRFNKFTIGWAWESDYGSPENPEEFKALFAYSPYHNLKPGTAYPATLITTGDHDDRVVPAHSFKFAARLQEMQSGSEPVLIRIETSAGHGAGKPTRKIIEETADRLAFLVKNLDMKVRGL